MSLFKSLGKIAKGFITGGPIGALGAGASLLTRQKADTLKSFTGFRVGGPSGFQIGTERMISRPLPPPVFDGAGQGTGLALAQCPAGFRLNKSTYVTRGGGTSRWPLGLQVHPKGSTCVKRRRRNVGNARALRRSISRVKGFVKLARKAHSLVGGGRRKAKQLTAGRGQQIISVD